MTEVTQLESGGGTVCLLLLGLGAQTSHTGSYS